MNEGYRFEKGVIIINRDLTELDLFLKDFLEIMKKYSDYLVVSGFVSICAGRARGTEDIDVLALASNKDNFSKLFNDLIKNGFWRYQ